MFTLDLRGLKCPLPVLRARKALRNLRGGQELVVWSTDPLAVLDIPHMAAEDGHAVLQVRQDGDATAFVLRKAYAAVPADTAPDECDARSTNITVDRPVTS